MAVGNTSPLKFDPFGFRKRRIADEKAKGALNKEIRNFERLDTSNLQAGAKNMYANMENVYEDQTVNLKAAEFEKEQSQQAMANIMQQMQGAAGSSGVAGLAQVLANQGVKQAQQASVSIANQEQANQVRAMGEAGRLQQLEREGEQKRDLMEREGARLVEQYDMDKQTKMLDMASQRQAAAAQAIDNANAQMDQFVSGAVTGVLGGVAGNFMG